MDTTLTLLAVGLILLPGWTLWTRLVGAQQSQEVAITGLSFAAAFAMVWLQVLAYLGLSVFIVAWLCLLPVALYLLYSRRPRVPLERTLLLLALGAAALRFLPALLQEFPPGWDPYFHLLVVRLIGQSGTTVASLSPFEDIALNYPIGTHLLIAVIAKCTGASMYAVFQAVLALFGSLTCLQVYAWVQAATGNRRWALYAMAAYAFLAMQGSLDYYLWGGLPNLLGMYLLAGCLTLIAQRDADPLRWWALPPMYVAIALSNHHVLLTAFVVMLTLLVWLALDPQRRADLGRLFLGGCAAAVLAVPFLAHAFLSAWHDIDATGLLTYPEPRNTLLFIATGYGSVYFVAVLAGMGLYARAPRTYPLRAELLLPAAAMLALFLLFEYGGRHLMSVLYQRPIAPFTPSRFLTDAACPLSAFAGLAFLRAQARVGRSVMPVVLALFMTNAAYYLRQFQPVIDPERVAAYRWVEANTRADTLVIDNWVHAPVLTNRASIHTALPSSELSKAAGKRKLLERIVNREVSADSAGVPVVMITHRQVPLVAPPGTVLFEYGLGEIVDLNPRAPARLP